MCANRQSGIRDVSYWETIDEAEFNVDREFSGVTKQFSLFFYEMKILWLFQQK